MCSTLYDAEKHVTMQRIILEQSVAHDVLRNKQRNDTNHCRSPVQHFTVRLEDGKLSALVKVVLRKLRRDGA